MKLCKNRLICFLQIKVWLGIRYCYMHFGHLHYRVIKISANNFYNESLLCTCSTNCWKLPLVSLSLLEFPFQLLDWTVHFKWFQNFLFSIIVQIMFSYEIVVSSLREYYSVREGNMCCHIREMFVLVIFLW